MNLNLNIDTDKNESTFDDLKDLQTIEDAKTLYEKIGDIIILDREREFTRLIERIVDICVMCWNFKDENGVKLQRLPVKFKVSIDSKETYSLPLNRFMISIVFLNTVFPYLKYIDISKFLLSEALTEKHRSKIQNDIYVILQQYGQTLDQSKDILSVMSHNLKCIALIFAPADMQIFTAENLFIDHYMESEVIREINNTEYDSSYQTADIVAANAEKYKILEKIMIERGNPVFLDNKYTKVIKPKQIEEMYINLGQIPDGRDVIPVTMNDNGFRGGYSTPAIFYAGAISARVPDIMNEDYMGKAGYFARNLWMLCYGTISDVIWDCGSVNPIEVDVDEVELEMKDGRYYTERKNSCEYKILHKEDLHLLGKKIWVRSPCTCNLNEDCCHICYGSKALGLAYLPGGFVYSTEIITKDVGQKILSAKHLLKTNAEKIEFSAGYEKYFTLENSTLVPVEGKRFDIYFREEESEDHQDSYTFYVGKDLFPITISKFAGIHMPDELKKYCKEVIIDDCCYLKITSTKVIDSDKGILFDIIPINIMMTATYMKIMNLIEDGVKHYTNVSELVSDFIHLLAGVIPVYSVHGEVVIGRLVRRLDNKMLRPNWTKPNPEYQILRLKSSLTNSESCALALAFETPEHQLFHQVFDLRNNINRVGPRSHEDIIFGEDLL